MSVLVALLIALAPASPSASSPTLSPAQLARLRAMQRLRSAPPTAAVRALQQPAPRKGKPATLPGRVGSKGKTSKGKPSKRKLAPPRRLGKSKPRARLQSAPCSTIEAGVHDGAVRPGTEGLVADRYWVWPNGARIHVHFRDGSPEARRAVAEVAAEWTQFANLDFVFHLEDAPPAQVDISITFDDPACNSAMGPSSKSAVAMGDASMRLCHIDWQIGSDFFRRTVLHEFGHAMGMHHEHQSPKAGFSWDKPAVYAYYAQIGWDQGFVDQWVFTRVSESEVRATEWDPDSVMHYEFPAEFTTDRVAIHGGTVLSAEDKRFIAEIYPGRAAPGSKPKPKAKPKAKPAGKLKHFTQRRIVLRNDTDLPLVIEVAVERRVGPSAWAWSAADPAKGSAYAVAPGAERLLPAALAGRAARVRARSEDGTAVWTDHLDPPVVLAEAGGYDDKVMQSVVIATAGDPDAPPALGRDALWDRAQAELDAGKWQAAREAFTDFIARHPDDAFVPWARLYILTAMLEQDQATAAAYAAYELIVDHPDADASRYAWYYGGVAALQRGACDDAQGYFEAAAQESLGLPRAWIDAANEYLAALGERRETWCG